jgi:hypothetical protein
LTEESHMPNLAETADALEKRVEGMDDRAAMWVLFHLANGTPAQQRMLADAMDAHVAFRRDHPARTQPSRGAQ